MLFLHGEALLSIPLPKPQAAGTPLVRCLQLLIQHPEAVTSIGNLRMRYAVLTRDSLKHDSGVSIDVLQGVGTPPAFLFPSPRPLLSVVLVECQ